MLIIIMGRSLPVGGLHVEVVDVHVYSLPWRRYHPPHALGPSRGSLGVTRGLDLSLRVSLYSKVEYIIFLISINKVNN